MKLRARASIALLTVLVLAPIAALSAAQPAGAIAPPHLTSVTPDNSFYEGGGTVTITGANLTGATSVHFWFFTASSFAVVNDTTITAVVPSNMGTGDVPLNVTTAAGTSNDLTFTYTSTPPPPVLDSVSPTSGVVVGGDSVTMVGHSLNETGLDVTFGGVAATPYEGDGPDQIKVFAPPHAAGAVDVTLSTDGGSSTLTYGFTYGTAPFVIGLSLNHASTTGGTTVTVQGTNFTGATAVMFGATPATGFSVGSDRSITATAPAHASGAVDVTVVSPGGTSTVRSADQFTFGGPTPPPPSGPGTACCRMVASDGGVFAIDGASYAGSMSGHALSHRIVGIAATAGGYWLVASDGGVFTFGTAGFHGSTVGRALSAPIVGMAVTSDGGGYWLAGADGAVYAFGDAPFSGSMSGTRLNAPIVGITATAHGYLLAASDGGVFAFGDAQFSGSMAGRHLNDPIVGLTATAHGYLLAGSDGGVFAFGGARMLGSMAGRGVTSPFVGIVDTTDGYVLASSDTTSFDFEEGARGTRRATTGAAPVVGIA